MLQTIKNMVEFATWHATDSMSPALNSDEVIENIEDPAEADKMYVEQLARIAAAREAFHKAIDVRELYVGDIITREDAKEVIVNMLEFFRDERLTDSAYRYFTVADEVESAKEILLEANEDLTEEQIDLIKRA